MVDYSIIDNDIIFVGLNEYFQALRQFIFNV